MEDSLSSSVELISASPSPQRAAPDKTRLLTWHTPRQPAPPTGLSRDGDSDSDSDSDSLRTGGRPRNLSLTVISDDDSPVPTAARRRAEKAVVVSDGDDDDDDVGAAPPASERRRARPVVISDGESDDDSIPCSQNRREGATRPGRRSEDVIEASFEGDGKGDWREQWGKSAASLSTTTTNASAAADSPDSGLPAGQDGDISGASMIASDESWDGTSVTSGQSSHDSGAAEDPAARARRLYSKYTIKKRTTPIAEATNSGDGLGDVKNADVKASGTPNDGQSHSKSPENRAVPGEREGKTSPPTAAGPTQPQHPLGTARAEKPTAGGAPSRTVIIVPTERQAGAATNGASVPSTGASSASTGASSASTRASSVSAGVSSASTGASSASTGSAKGTSQANHSSVQTFRGSPEVSSSSETANRPAPAPTPTTVGPSARPGTTGTTATAVSPTQESELGPDGVDLAYLSIHELEQQLKQKEMVARVSNLSALPDGGRRLTATIQQLRSALERKRSVSVRPAVSGQNTAARGPPQAARGPTQTSRAPPQAARGPPQAARGPPQAARGPPQAAQGSSGGGGGRAGGMSELQQVQALIRQKKMEYSTSAHRADPARSAQLQKDIFKLETEMMRLQMAKGGSGNTVRNPFSLNTTITRPPPPNKPQPGPSFPRSPSAELEAALRRGERTTAVVTEEQRRLEEEARESLRDFGQIRPQLTAALLASNPELSRLYGGRMTEARHRQASNVTTEVLERLHRSLETLPPPSASDAGPECLNVSLMPHQRYALSWLQWRERQLPAGGVLADDMGLGKTLTMIAHCLRSAELERQDKDKEKDGEDKENAGEGDVKEEKDGDRDTDKEQKDFADGKGGKWLSKNKPTAKDGEKTAAPPPSSATLVVCPASVLLQWEAEVKRRTTGGITAVVYHGPNRRADHRRLRKADFVLTTYDLVRQEVEKDSLIGANKACPSPLMSYTWRRIILDEAHQIRNRNTKSAKAVCELQAGKRWLLSGTPIQNGREDFFSLMRFLRAAPFHEYEVWKRWIDKSPRGDERLSLIVRAMVLRRTKDQASPATGKPLVALPPREKRSHTVELDKREREVYDKVFEFCRSSLQEFIKLQEQREYEKELKTNPLARPPPGLNVKTPYAFTAGPGVGSDGVDGGPSGLGQKGSIKQHHLLVQLLRLRQICCHPGLAKTVMTSSDREAAGVDVEEDAADLETQLMGLSLNETSAPAERKQASVLSADNPVFSRDWRSAKLVRLMREVQAIVAAGEERVVVVSQWTSMLDIVREHLSAARVPSCTISGAVKMAERQDLIDAFNGAARRGPRVMLLSLLAGGVGLNLVGGNHLFILDPHWNPQLEEQAGDRIYRVGQKRSVFIHRFVCKDTLEERILELQQKKLNIARGVLSGDKQAASNRLTMSDLKTLFNMQ